VNARARQQVPRPCVLVDTREQVPLRFSDAVDVEVVGLPAGDYSVRGFTDSVAIERKSADDYAACCGVDRDRFLDQAKRLTKYPVRLVLLSCSWEDLAAGRYRSKLNPKSATGTSLALTVDYGIPVFFAGSEAAAAEVVERIAVRIARDGVELPRQTLAAEVVAAVRAEVRESSLAVNPREHLPPPCDLDREAEILSAVLCAHVTTAELAPLEGRHFYADRNRGFWEAARDNAPGDLEGVARALHTRGWRGGVATDLEVLTTQVPFCLLPRLREHVRALIELWGRRQVLEAVSAADAALRGRELGADAVRRNLEARFREVLG
jgi:DNA excision repair protein ERCC-4